MFQKFLCLTISVPLVFYYSQVTVTSTQTVRVPVTSDVWVSTVTQSTVTGTQLSTLWSFTPVSPVTVTSVMTITNTPVSPLLFLFQNTLNTYQGLIGMVQSVRIPARSYSFHRPCLRICSIRFRLLVVTP